MYVQIPPHTAYRTLRHPSMKKSMKKIKKKTKLCSDDEFWPPDVLRSTGDQKLGWMAMCVVISPLSLSQGFF